VATNLKEIDARQPTTLRSWPEVADVAVVTSDWWWWRAWRRQKNEQQQQQQ